MCDAGGGAKPLAFLIPFLFKTRVFPPGLNSILPAYSNADRKKERNSAERSRGNGKKEKTLKLPEMKCLHTKSSSFLKLLLKYFLVLNYTDVASYSLLSSFRLIPTAWGVFLPPFPPPF